MAEALGKRGHEVAIFTTNQDGDGELDVPLGVPVKSGNMTIFYFSIRRPRFWGYSSELRRALRKEASKYDLVHVHALYMFQNWITGYYCRKFDIPYVISPHGSLDPFIFNRHRARKSIIERLFEKRNFSRAAGVHYVTDEERECACRIEETSSEKGFVVPIGLHLETYENLPPKGRFRERYPGLADAPIVLFFGRVNYKKGLDLLVQAFKQVVLKHPGAVLVIAGPDNEGYGDKVIEWVAEAGLSDKVIFTGMLQGDDKLAVLADSDVFVLPSYSENFGIAVVEAMACGLPVIISDKVNLWREVERHAAGMITTCDVDSVAECINETLGNPRLRNELANNGKALVRNRYRWEQVAASMEREYMKLVRKGNNSVTHSIDLRGDARV